jgi:hypothetical protein
LVFKIFPPSFAPVQREQELGLELRARRVENGILKKYPAPHLLIAPFLIAFKLTSAPLPHIAEVANHKREMDFRYQLSSLPPLFSYQDFYCLL